VPKKKPITQAVVKVKPVKIEEPIEVCVAAPRTGFPERLKIVSGEDETVYSREQLEAYYEAAVGLCGKSKLASCWEWVRELKINYGAAVWIMDVMEYRGHVRPIEFEGEAASSAPRKFTVKT